MDKSQETQLGILKETVEFYGKDPDKLRSVNGIRHDGKQNCVYNASGGRHCALGRYLMTKYKKKGKKLLGNEGAGSDSLAYHNGFKDRDIDHMLSPKYRGFPRRFWDDLQGVHDTKEDWDSGGGMTLKGEGKVKTFQSKIESEYYLDRY